MRIFSFSSTTTLAIIIPLLLLHHVSAQQRLVLTAKILNITLEAARLSSFAYEAQEDGTINDLTEEEEYERYYNITGFNDDDADAAVVARGKDGYCYGAFRGTMMDLSDWYQNLDPSREEVSNVGGGSCDVRQGYKRGYFTNYYEEFERALRACADTCADKDECVVLTGHSQGGAIADVASVRLADLTPYVVTFGQPPAVYAPCPYFDNEKVFRYVNTYMYGKEMDHDPVPFGPALGANYFGYMIVLSYQDYAVASFSLGYKVPGVTGPFHLNLAPFQAHSMYHDSYSYLNRIQKIQADAKTYPIPSEGWNLGDSCGVDEECESNLCADFVCKEKLPSCGECEDDHECQSNSCYLYRCTRPQDDLMDLSCICGMSSDCHSGRCEGIRHRRCVAKLGHGEGCTENTDCLSSKCTWYFRCEGGTSPKARFHIY